MSAFLRLNLWEVFAGARELIDKASRGSDSLREPDAQLLKGEFKIFHSQFLVGKDHDPLEDGAPGKWRRVSRRLHEVSSPRSRLEEGIG